MRRTLTILVVGLLVAVLAIGGIAPAVSAHGDDTEQNPYADGTNTTNVTDAHAAAMVEWMTAQMGPEGVAAFEQETGTSIEVVAHAMAEQMEPATGTWNDSAGTPQYGPGWGGDYQAPGSGYGPGMHGPGMNHGGHMGTAWGYGPSAGEGYGSFGGPGMFGGQSGQYGGQGYSPSQGPGMFGGQGQGFFGGFGPGNWFGAGGGPGGSGGHGMGGGMGGMGNGW